jgi:hypothetical protein
MQTLQEIDRLTEKELIREVLRDPNCDLGVDDAVPIIRLKYLYSQLADLNASDRTFVENFPKFSVYYIKSQDCLLDLLQEEELYFFEDCARSFLIAVCGFVYHSNKACLVYLGSKLSCDTLCSLLTWRDLTYDGAIELFDMYTAPVTEEIVLTMEGLGFGNILNEKLPQNVLYLIFQYSEKKKNWRYVSKFFHECKALPGMSWQYAPIITQRGSNTRRKFASAPAIPYELYTVVELAKRFNITLNIAQAIIDGNLHTIENTQQEKKNFVCQSRVYKLCEYVSASSYCCKNITLDFLIEIFNKFVNDGNEKTIKGRVMISAKLTCLLARHNRKLRVSTRPVQTF